MYRLPSPFHRQARDNTLSAASGGCTTTTCSCTVVTAGAGCIATAVHFVRLTQGGRVQDTALEPGSPKASVAHKAGLGLLGFLALPVLLGIALWLKQGLPSVLLSLGGWIALFAAGMVELWLWSMH